MAIGGRFVPAFPPFVAPTSTDDPWVTCTIACTKCDRPLTRRRRAAKLCPKYCRQTHEGRITPDGGCKESQRPVRAGHPAGGIRP